MGLALRELGEAARWTKDPKVQPVGGLGAALQLAPSPSGLRAAVHTHIYIAQCTISNVTACAQLHVTAFVYHNTCAYMQLHLLIRVHACTNTHR